MLTYTLKIAEIVKETEDACTICFKPPALKKIKYSPGQYITLIITINNRKYKRPYSLSSAPGIDSTLNITVKRLLHGIVSNHLLDVVKEGDIMEVIEPMGDFVYENEAQHDKQIFLWGAGSGITPLMSILKTVLHTSSKQITLTYCNKSVKQAIFYEQLIVLKNQYPNRFLLNFFFTEERGKNGQFGRINSANVIEILKNVTDNVATINYICGPLGLKETIKSTLLNDGSTQHTSLTEDFEHIINENELKGIQTRFVEIIKDNEKTKFEVTRGKSILEAALDRQIDFSYSCQTGSCTLCKARIISGDVKKIGTQSSENEIKEDERLLCCSYPLTDDVIFEVD